MSIELLLEIVVVGIGASELVEVHVGLLYDGEVVGKGGGAVLGGLVEADAGFVHVGEG